MYCQMALMMSVLVAVWIPKSLANLLDSLYCGGWKRRKEDRRGDKRNKHSDQREKVWPKMAASIHNWKSSTLPNKRHCLPLRLGFSAFRMVTGQPALPTCNGFQAMTRSTCATDLVVECKYDGAFDSIFSRTSDLRERNTDTNACIHKRKHNTNYFVTHPQNKLAHFACNPILYRLCCSLITFGMRGIC